MRQPPATGRFGGAIESTYESHEFGRLPTQELSCCCRGEAAELAHRSNPAGPKRGDLFGCELIKLFEREPFDQCVLVSGKPKHHAPWARHTGADTRRHARRCNANRAVEAELLVHSVSELAGPIQWRRWRPQRTLSRAPRRSLRQDRFIRRRPLPSLGESSQRTIDAIGERNQVVEPSRGRRIEETLDGHMDHGSLARHRRTGPDRAQWTLPPSLPFAQPTFE